MPRKAAKLCAGVGCHARTLRRYCDACRERMRRTDRQRRAAADRLRPSSAKRGYDRTWRRVRLAYLADQPFCETPGCPRPAEQVHHVDNDSSNNDADNLQALCRPCHAGLTQRERGMHGTE